MSITDELRKWWVRKFPVMDKELHKDFTAIADRIDAEHQKAIRELNNLADASVLLPVDADGVPIRVGDVMESKNGIREVDALQKSSRKWSVGLVPVGGGAFSWHDAETLLHHHAPTVEDLLFSYGQSCIRVSNEAETDAAKQTMLTKLREEYAAKLRLAEGEDA